MPRQPLTDFQNRLAGLRTCFALTKQELDSSPVCQHCNFRLVSEPNGKATSVVIKQMEDDLGQLHETWTKTILSNLEDPATRKNLALLKAPARTAIEGFLKRRELPEGLNHGIVGRRQNVLAGCREVCDTD